MVFSSTVFLFLFLPLTLCIYYNPLFTGRRFRNVFLLLASLLFYAWGEPVFVFLMLLSIGGGTSGGAAFAVIPSQVVVGGRCDLSCGVALRL